MISNDEYRVLSPKEMDDIEDDQVLIDYILKGEKEKKKIEFEIKRNELSDDIRHEPDIYLGMNGVKEGFVFKKIGEKNKEQLQLPLGFPYYDERRNPMYREQFQGVDMIPPKGFFWLIDTVVKNRPFGVYSTHTYVSQVTRKMNDFRHPDIRKLRNNFKDKDKVYVDEKDFYFDFDKKCYVQVFKENTVKDDGTTDDPETQVFLDIEDSIHYITVRFSKVLEEYRLFFIKKFKDIFLYSKSVNSSKGYFKVFDLYEELLSESKKNLPIKLILGQINNYVYDEISKEIDVKLGEVSVKRKEIKKKLVEEGIDNIVFNALEFSSKYVPFYRVLGSNNTVGFLKEIVDFIRKKPEWDKVERLTTEGYIEIRGEGGQLTGLVPNLGTVETRDFFSEFQSSEDKVNDYERRVIASLDVGENIEQDENEVSKFEQTGLIQDLFTEKEKEELVEHLRSGRSSRFDTMFLKKVKEHNIDSIRIGLLNTDLKTYISSLIYLD